MTLPAEIIAAMELNRQMDDARKRPQSPHSHEPSGFQCLVYHGDGHGQCDRCRVCGEYYR